MESVSDLDSAVKAADCVVIVTNHSAYDYQKMLADAKIDCGHPQRAGIARPEK